jgi:hypothetical protein
VVVEEKVRSCEKFLLKVEEKIFASYVQLKYLCALLKVKSYARGKLRTSSYCALHHSEGHLSVDDEENIFPAQSLPPRLESFGGKGEQEEGEVSSELITSKRMLERKKMLINLCT